MLVKFWGVRGALPTPDPCNAGVGGNTACLQVELDSGQTLIFDAGSGLRPLGMELQREAEGRPRQSHLLLTHFHWDHIQGLPFFAPLYSPENAVSIYSAAAPERTSKILEVQMAPPYYPIRLSTLPAERRFVCIAGRELYFGDTRITNFPLFHPQGSTGYRVDCGTRSFVFATDHEHGNPDCDAALVKAAVGTDVLVCDAQYTPEEYEQHKGWGHTHWLHATDIARRAGVGRLILFHHHPGHDDLALERILDQARGEFPATDLAVEGETFELV